MAMFSARGLNNFISDLRATTSREEETKRIDKELAKIRQKFTQNTTLNSYDKKKYAWKIIYIYMLGYDIDFGHMQVINLVAGSKYSEKCLGYLGCSILLKSSDELMTLVVNAIRNDLKSNEACHQCLALCCVANLGGNEYSEVLSPDVVNLFLSSASIAHVRKKASLCTRRMLASNAELIPLENLEPRLHTLMSEAHLGVVTSAASLLHTALTLHPTSFRTLIEVCINRLASLVIHKACPRDYMYYNTPAPWLQVKILRILQLFGPLEENILQEKLTEVLRRILSRPSPGKGAKNNATYAVLIETVNLVISYGKRADLKLKEQAIQLLAKFISVSEPNIRYIGLDSLYRLVRLEGDVDAIKQHKNTVLFSLKDTDNSVRRRALDLLFSMCDSENALEIVGELVNYLTIAESGSIREEIVLKAAILAEKYAKNLQWYVDTVLQLITIAGSQVPDDVWHRVVQIVTNKEELQKYAAEIMFHALEPKHVDETTAKFGAYILGEFGYLICDTPEMSAEKQFDVLYKHYVITSSIPTKSLILTAFIKMINLYEEIKPRIVEVLKKSSTNMDLEIQQRACEYLGIQQIGDDIMKKVFEPMPVFPDNRESALLLRLRKQEKNNQNTENADEKENTIRSHSSNSSNNSSSIGGKNHGSAASSPSNEVDDDLLGLDTTLPTQPMSNKNNAGALGGLGGGKADIRGPSPVGDLLDVFGGGVASPPAPMGGVIGIEASLTPKLVEWSKNIMISNSGVLFENDLIQIGVKQEFRGSQGRINLFYGNKGSDNYNNFKVSYEAGPSFRLQAEDMGNCLASRQQLKQQIMIESMGPFTSSPVMKVSFTRNNGASYLYNLKLPATVTSFIEPVPLVRDDFMKRWGALEGQEREQQEVFTAQNKIDMAHNRSILTEKIKFAIAEGVDANDTSITIAGTFRTGAATPTGEKISVGALVRVEANTMTNSYRVTVRAVHKDVALGLKNCIKTIIA